MFDQYTKWLILEHVMQPPRVITVTSFFNLVMAWNTGISFGMFASDSPLNRWLLPGLALVVVAGLAIWLYRTSCRFIGIGLALIIGGAVGNVIDRVRFGAVADFLDIHLAGYHWPAFNVADSAITIGAAILILDSLFRRPESSRNDDDAPATKGDQDG
ncbi:MAG: signal peptidase II [Rhodospirillales bacterium]|nr:signal peptidase II [Rhodospirillales bacterium]